MSKQIPLPQKTVYYSAAMQMYMMEEIKKPVLQAVKVLFHPESNTLDKAKAAKMLWGAFNALKGLPEPTKDNTWHPNTHQLIDLRDWLFEHCHLPVIRMSFIKRIMDFVIILYDFDPPWRWIFDSLWEEARKKEWKPKGWNDTWTNDYHWWKE